MHEFSDGVTAQDIDRRLWLELPSEQYRLVQELVRLESDRPIIGLLDESERIVAALAERFPALRAEILAAAQEIVERGAIYEDGASEPVRGCGDWRPGPASTTLV
ncbi:MAG: hypothetical protein IT306_21620 [Chloroflexi bacterium]|nr:hypothetical protein [Chloroflexota bacterium]